MKIEEVLPALREGKKIRRASWKPAWFTSIVDRMGNYNRVARTELFLDDVLADDWEIIG